MGFNLKFSIGFVFATKRLLQMNTAGLFTEVAKRENSASCPHLPTLSGEHTIDGSALPLPRTITHYYNSALTTLQTGCITTQHYIEVNI